MKKCKKTVLEDCSFDPDADRAFEKSSVQATIRGGITSIVKPLSGYIRCDASSEIIRDEIQTSPCAFKIEIG